jgi:hypothetical protein
VLLLRLRRDLPLIPTHAAAAATGQQQQQQQQQQQWLASPKSLFDPRTATFLQLLDPMQHFPAAPFDGGTAAAAAAVQPGGAAAVAAAATVSGSQLLDSLALCGMKTQIDMQVGMAPLCFHARFWYLLALPVKGFYVQGSLA